MSQMPGSDDSVASFGRFDVVCLDQRVWRLFACKLQ